MGVSQAMDDIIDGMNPQKPSYVYVASSWRNRFHVEVVAALRSSGISCYDFKHDEGAQFKWSEVGVISGGETYDKYRRGLLHPRAEAGFSSDFNAMKRASHCVLVLPCGRSAHLEAGWMIGQGKPTAILMEPDHYDEVSEVVLYTPELMYKMADYITDNLLDLMSWLGAED